MLHEHFLSELQKLFRNLTVEIFFKHFRYIDQSTDNILYLNTFTSHLTSLWKILRLAQKFRKTTKHDVGFLVINRQLVHEFHLRLISNHSNLVFWSFWPLVDRYSIILSRHDSAKSLLMLLIGISAGVLHKFIPENDLEMMLICFIIWNIRFDWYRHSNGGSVTHKRQN